MQLVVVLRDRYTPATEVVPLNLSYAEQPDMEQDTTDESVS